MPLPTRSEATDILRDFGLDIKSVEVDVSGFRRVRFRGKDKRNRDGFYKAYSMPGTDMVAGVYGSYSPFFQVHKFKGLEEINDAFSFKARRILEKKIEQDLEEADQEPDFSIWREADPCSSHPYLDFKKINAYGEIRVLGDELLIPAYCDGELQTFQRIFYRDGWQKRFIKHGKKKGAYFTIPGSDVVALCEGYATGATIHEATGWTVVVAFDCGNLINVAKYFKDRRLIVCADDDWQTPGNPGVTAAKAVADRFCCDMAVPIFGGDRGKKDSDFNDLGLEKAESQLCGKAPKSLRDNLLDLDSEGRERFLYDRRKLLALYTAADLCLLKNQLKREFGIAKSTIDEFVKGELNEEELEKRDDARSALRTVRVYGSGYFRLDGDRFYSTSAAEVSLSLKVASGGDPSQQQALHQGIHRAQAVSEVLAKITPFGRSHTEEFLDAEGQLHIHRLVSMKEVLESRLAEIDVEIDESFISHIKNNYREVIDIIDASLARKFAHHKKSFVYLKVCSDYGKSFFFDIERVVQAESEKYEIDSFKGNKPEDFVRSPYFFIDEATCFPSHYKIDAPTYRMNYGGLARVNLAMRLLVCANSIPDLEEGVDAQIQNRVVTIKASQKKFSHCGLPQKKTKAMWDKWILTRMINLLTEWSIDGDFEENAQAAFKSFLDKYDQNPTGKSNAEKLRECLVEMLETDHYPKNAFPFRENVVVSNDGRMVLTNTRRLVYEVIRYFDEGREKSFKKEYSSLESLESLSFLRLGLYWSDKHRVRGAAINVDTDEYGNKILVDW